MRVVHCFAVKARLSGILLAATLLAGCATGSETEYQASNVGAPDARAIAPQVETEADGLPAQTPPLRRNHAEPDDPNEPYSPNYGSGGRLPRTAWRAEPNTSAVSDTRLVALTHMDDE